MGQRMIVAAIAGESLSALPILKPSAAHIDCPSFVTAVHLVQIVKASKGQ